jgi:PKD repeat protein
MKNYVKKFTLISFFQLILIIILIPSLPAQYSNSITIEGYTYMNGIKIVPEQVSLILPDEMRFATLFDDGKYQIILSISVQLTGTFLIKYQNNWYNGGTITIIEESDYYDNNIYITTGSGDNDTEPIADAGGPYFRDIDETIFFDGSASYDPDGIITIYEWDFGDGTIGSGVAPTHTYSLVGNYTVTLIVTDNENKIDLDITYVIIEGESIEPSNLQPIADARGPYYGDIDETIYFDGSNSYDTDGIIVEYEWDLGDESTSLGITSTHTYSSIGNYTITLTVIDNEGKTDFDITYANISKLSTDPTNIIPTAEAGGPYYEIINIPITLDGTQSFDSDGSIIEYIWDFGDGHIGIGEIVTHEYIREGRYDISLKVIDNNLDFHIDATYVIITDKPNYPPNKPDVTGASLISINKLQNYEAESTDPDGDDIKYYFNWGDGSLDTETELVSNGTIIQSNHSWKYPGLFQLVVYVEDEKGVKSDINIKNILVDAIFCSNIGLLIDYTNDGVYDFFQSNTTNNKTSTILKENGYLIDTDGDKKWDYIFDVNTDSLTSYSTNYDWLVGLTSIPIIYIGVFAIIIFAILLIIYFYYINRKKSDKNRIYFTKEKSAEKETKEEIIEEEKTDSKVIKIDEIEKRIDELISKK